jgi:hypothetical protein
MFLVQNVRFNVLIPITSIWEEGGTERRGKAGTKVAPFGSTRSWYSLYDRALKTCFVCWREMEHNMITEKIFWFRGSISRNVTT